MNRRELLVVLGGTVALPLSDHLAALGRGLHVRAARRTTPPVLDPHQTETVATIAELIIPATDTPGARAARVHEFIDLALAEWLEPSERDRFLAGLADVDARTRALYGADFLACAPAQQVATLAALDGEVGWGRRGAEPGSRGFFGMMKQLTLVGYYTSEIGATQELHYQIVPGRYDGCYPLERRGS
jgi:hypothetical protein